MAGRGVDILLGGNPEGLAKSQLAAAGHDPNILELNPELPEVQEFFAAQPEVKAAFDEATAVYKELKAAADLSCKAEGDQVRALGGLYVLATERHESRRIDNQLRGRSGRQGDPGESRFYLSLEDELMRLFATGAMNWVMGKALPDDVPIEAKMVSKAIERAQTTVEGRNAEIRKNVLKYDEVMNQQRKVIYSRREAILHGDDLRAQLMDSLRNVIQTTTSTHCLSDRDEWDLEALLTAISGYYPTEFSVEDLSHAASKEVLIDGFVAEAEQRYEAREAELGAEVVRDVERNILLSIIDQRWREHLQEMDYLQEGINLRAMGQKDPLVEWQREGFELFAGLITAIDDDFVRYAMHAEIVIEQAPAPLITNMELSAADEGNIGGFGLDVGAMFDATAPAPAPSTEGELVQRVSEPEPAPLQPLVKTDLEKTGRNDPCHCGSGKKFKNCHGK
jgi:preprotein translocase subunit SecA